MIANLKNGLKEYMTTMLNRGTTCLAAKELNRKFIGIEKEPKYYKIACQRCGF
jgi:DNA modification methylase